MIPWECDGCGKKIEVEDNYEPEYCCRGLKDFCNCHGKPMNLAFCDDCEEKTFGEK